MTATALRGVDTTPFVLHRIGEAFLPPPTPSTTQTLPTLKVRLLQQCVSRSLSMFFLFVCSAVGLQHTTTCAHTSPSPLPLPFSFTFRLSRRLHPLVLLRFVSLDARAEEPPPRSPRRRDPCRRAAKVWNVFWGWFRLRCSFTFYTLTIHQLQKTAFPSCVPPTSALLLIYTS